MRPLPGPLLRAVLDTAAALADLDHDAARQGLPELARLFDADLATYHRIDPGGRLDEALVYPHAALGAAHAWPQYRQHLAHNPFVQHYASGQDRTPRRLSELTSTRQLQRSAAIDYYRLAHIKHQMALPLPVPPGQVVGFTVCRSSGQDFTDDDRDVLALLRPHLARLHRQQPNARIHLPLQRDQPGVVALHTPADPHQDPAPSSAARASGAPHSAATAPLTDRERQVLELAQTGHTNTRIARQLEVSSRTVGKHLENAYRKLGVSNRTAAVATTWRHERQPSVD